MAARRRVRFDAGADPALDLTPMIDIVFNLVIFFLVVSELSNLNVEQLELPRADRSREPDEKGERTLQLNVLATGVVKVRGGAYAADPRARPSLPPLAAFLEIEAAGWERDPPEPGQLAAPSRLRVNIRADAGGRFGDVQGVLDACIRNGIHRTSIAATPDPRR